MSLILCLEDSAGQDTELEVNEGDDFATFLQKAKDILGYEVDITSITGDKEVNLTDNIYQFLVTNEVEGEEEEESATVEEDIMPSRNLSSNQEEEGNIDEAGADFDKLEEKLKQLENDVKSTNFVADDDDGMRNEINIVKSVESKVVQDELDEVEDVEYLMEDTEEEELLNTVKETSLHKEDAEEFAEIEYLDDDDNDGQVEEEEMEVEMLDSDLEDDIMDNLGLGEMMTEQKESLQQRRKEKKVSFSELVGLNKELEADKALLSSLNDEELQPPNSEGKQYTRKQLLDILEDSGREDSDDDTDLTTRQKIANRGKRKLDSYDKKMMKDLFYSTPIQTQKKKRRVSFEIDSKEARETPRFSRAEMEYLKTTVRQPIIEVTNMTLSEINLCLGSKDEIEKFIIKDSKFINSKSTPTLDDWKYMPSKYEDVDNDGIYDYLDRDDEGFDPHDDGLLTVIGEKPQSKRTVLQNKDDVASAVRGIQRLFGTNTPIRRKRGRPRKYENVTPAPKPKPARRESADYDVFEDIKKEPGLDSDDDEYVPGSHIDWTKNRHKGKTVGFECRMCGTYMAKLGQVNSHALSHRLPGKAVFPCILCPYGYTTYSELCKHIREEHDPKKLMLMKKLSGNRAKSSPGSMQMPKKGRGRPPKKLSDERQRQQDNALVGTIISNYTETPKSNKSNYPAKKYQADRSESHTRIIQPKFKMQSNYGSNDDSEDVEDIHMLEEWLDDEEELYIMEMRQNALEAENSSDRSRAAEADEAHRTLTGKHGEDSVFKAGDVHLDNSVDIVQRIKAELLADRDDFEFRQLNVSKVVGEDHEKSLENDRIAFMSSITDVTEKIKANSLNRKNGGFEMSFDKTIMKIEPLKVSPDFVPGFKDVEEFSIRKVDPVNKPGKSIMDIACEGISELIDPSFSTENIVHMPTLEIDIAEPKLIPIGNTVYNLEDAVMESKQYDPSILSIEEDPQEFDLDDSDHNITTVSDVDSFVNKTYEDLDADVEVGEIREEEIAQQNDASDKLVDIAVNDQGISSSVDHSGITHMPKLDDIVDYQVEPEKLQETDNNEYKVNDMPIIFDESHKIGSDVDLFDNGVSKSLPIIDDCEKQTPENILKLDEESSYVNESDDFVSVKSSRYEMPHDNIDGSQEIDFVDEFEKTVPVDSEGICQESEKNCNIDNDKIIDDTLSINANPEVQMVLEDAENVSTKGETILHEDDKIEYNDFVEDSKESEDLDEIADEKTSENVSHNVSPKLNTDSNLHPAHEDNMNETVNETDEIPHDVEDVMSKLHADTVSCDDENNDEMQNSDAVAESEDNVYEVSESSNDMKESSLDTSKILHPPEDICLSVSSDENDITMMDCERSSNTKNYSIDTVDRTDEKSIDFVSSKRETVLKPGEDHVSSDDDVVTMDYDDFSNEPISESCDRLKSENFASKKNSKEHKSHFREFSISSKDSCNVEDTGVPIGLEFDHSKQLAIPENIKDSSFKPVGGHILIDEDDRLDYEDFPSAPSASESRKEISDESLVPKLDDSIVLMDDSDDVIDFNISRSESNLSDQNV